MAQALILRRHEGNDRPWTLKQVQGDDSLMAVFIETSPNPNRKRGAALRPHPFSVDPADRLGNSNHREASRNGLAFDAHWMLSLPPIARMKQV